MNDNQTSHRTYLCNGLRDRSNNGIDNTSSRSSADSQLTHRLKLTGSNDANPSTDAAAAAAAVATDAAAAKEARCLADDSQEMRGLLNQSAGGFQFH